MRLPRKFFARPTLKVAQDLLGKFLVIRKTARVQIPDLTGKDPGSTESLLVGKIVETEAYIGIKDKACHASWRRRESCEVMWGLPGQAYVYFTYGLHWLLNVVTERQGFPAAVLIRALDPVEGVKEMMARREIKKLGNKGKKRNEETLITQLLIDSKYLLELTNGPAKLTQALGVDGSFNGEDLVQGSRIWVEDRGVKCQKSDVKRSPRVGVGYAQEYQDKLWRFYLRGNSFVSKRD